MSDRLAPSVVAVVPTYNRKDLVTEVIKGLLEQTVPVERVVVVDNASSDDTEGHLRQEGILDDERVDFRRSETNTGSAGGFRLGMERASEFQPDWLWVVDNDAIPSSTALENFLREAETLGNHGQIALSSFQIQLDGKELTYQLPRTLTDALRYGLGCPKIKASKGAEGAVPIDWLTFVSVLLPGSVVASVGLPLEDLFYYHEDFDYSLRMREKGYGAFLIPSSLVDHRKPRDGAAHVPGWKRYYAYRNTIYVIRTRGRQLGFGLRAAVLARVTVGGLLWVVRSLIRRDLASARLTARGVVDGYRSRLGLTVLPGSSK